MKNISPLILAIESSCDETAAAIIDGNLQVLGRCVATQDDLHERFRGVVPEIAARAHLERMLPVLKSTCESAGIVLSRLDAIAVVTMPGLSNSLLTGLITAKTLALVLNRPLIAVNHLHAHVFAGKFRLDEAGNLLGDREIYPCVGLIVSGGHTHVYHYRDPLNAELLGGTIDDAAGEAFDKVATMLGLGFPGGPALSKVAESGSPDAIRFPRSYFGSDEVKFSFSGLKTAVRYAIAGPGQVDFSSLKLSGRFVADVAASFERAVVDVLVDRAVHAVRRTGVRTLCVGGGVAANRLLRSELERASGENDFQLIIAPRELCTDNAVMAAIAIEQFRAGDFASLETDIHPGLIRGA